jgi:hypothetical protein
VPPSVSTPTTRAVPLLSGPLTKPSTFTPRRTVTRGSFSAARACTYSTMGRRPVTKANWSSSGRGSRSVMNGGRLVTKFTQVPPFATRLSKTSGSSAWRILR